jgi:threonine dehydratase
MSLITDTAAAAVRAHTRIRAHIYETPLIPSRALQQDGQSGLFFKAENFQKTGSFKIRGATAKMTAIHGDQGLITASSGNHGIACAVAAAQVGRTLTVVLPTTVAPAKLDRIRASGVEMILQGADSGLAEAHAQSLARSRNLFYVSPYNDADVIAGQGSIGLELLEQHAQIDNVFVSMGGGGLISGIGAVLKAFSPRTRIIGVAAQNSAALAAAMQAGRVVEVDHVDTLADGVAGGMDTDSLTLPLSLEVIDRVLTCTENDITQALRHMAFAENQLVEGAAALALAGYLQIAAEIKDQTNVVLLCGANFDKAKILAALIS